MRQHLPRSKTPTSSLKEVVFQWRHTTTSSSLQDNGITTPRRRPPVAPRDNTIIAPRLRHYRSQKSSSGGTTRHRHPRVKTTTPSLQEAVLRWHSLLGSAHGPRYWNRTRNLHGHGFQLMRRTFLCCRHQRAYHRRCRAILSQSRKHFMREYRPVCKIKPGPGVKNCKSGICLLLLKLILYVGKNSCQFLSVLH